MSETIYRDVFDAEVVLTDVVREIILTKHPEVALFIEHVGSVLLTPQEIRRSVNDERVVLYYRYESDVLGGKWIVVVVKRVDRNFISTIYATDKIKAGEVIWTRK